MNLIVTARFQEGTQLFHLTLILRHVEHLLGCQVLGLDDVGQFFLCRVDFHLGQERALGLFCQFVARGVGDTVLAAMLDEFLHHQPVVPVAELPLGIDETGRTGEAVLHLPETDIVVVLVHQAVAEEQQQQHILRAQAAYLLALFHEAYLRIVLEQLLNLCIEVLRGDGIVVQVLEQLVKQFEQPGAVQALAAGQFIYLVMLQGLNHGLRYVEHILVFGIAVAQQAAVYQGIDVLAVAEDTDIADIEVAGQVIVIHPAGTFLHADAEQDGLSLGDAVALGYETHLIGHLSLRLSLQHGILRHLYHFLDGTQQRHLFLYFRSLHDSRFNFLCHNINVLRFGVSCKS